MRRCHKIDVMQLRIKRTIKGTHIGSGVRFKSHVIRCKMELFLFSYSQNLNRYYSQYILGCKRLETLRISKCIQLSTETMLKIPGSLLSLKALSFDDVDCVNSNSLQTLFTNSNLRLNEFGLTETSKFHIQHVI